MRGPVGHLLRSLIEINVRDRALILTGQAFTALVPLLAVVASWADEARRRRRQRLARGEVLIVRRLCSGCRAAFVRPPSASSTTSILGVLLTLISLGSLARSLQRTFEAAWGASHRQGVRPSLRAVGGLLLVLLLVVAQEGLRELPSPALAAVLVFVLAIPAWWLVSRLWLSHRVAWVQVLPGAVIAAAAQVGALLLGTVWVPFLIARDSASYDVVGSRWPSSPGWWWCRSSPWSPRCWAPHAQTLAAQARPRRTGGQRR